MQEWEKNLTATLDALIDAAKMQEQRIRRLEAQVAAMQEAERRRSEERVRGVSR